MSGTSGWVSRLDEGALDALLVRSQIVFETSESERVWWVDFLDKRKKSKRTRNQSS